MELIFKTERVTDAVTRIFAFNTELMYLVEGKERAALLDTGSGFGSLKECVSALTDKPVTVLLTHGHTDHALGAAEFEDVYISPLDKAVYAVHSCAAFRANSGSMWPDFARLAPSQIIPPMPFEKMKPLRGGDSFDLGGESIDVYPCPGHTLGSMVFLLREERLLLLGDACNPCTFLFDEFTTGVSDYKAALISLQSAVRGKFDRVLLSHGDGWGGADMIESVTAVCDDILAGRSDEQPFEFLGQHALLAKAVDADRRRLDGGTGNIVYSSVK